MNQPEIKPLSQFESKNGLRLLPFRLNSIDKNRMILINIAGEYVVLKREDAIKVVNKEIKKGTDLYDNLKSNHFIYDSDSEICLELLSAKYRTKQSLLPEFTSLHMFVVTLRCEHSCQYCQVSRVSQDKVAYDMTKETADNAINLLFKSPSSELKVEFQGGEPLLNFPLVKYVVESVKKKNDGRQIQFVVATNLALIDDEMLEFFKKEDVYISTSIDGPADLHNKNRPRPGHNSHQLALAGINKVRETLGKDKVSALMTCSKDSLNQVEEIIDEYIRLEFPEIFLRGISPYGFAVRGRSSHYDEIDFVNFYKQGLDYILELNFQGKPIRESYTCLLLQRLLTPWPTGYVDLQSPSGIAISAISYNYNGDVYASDEGRMLAEMHDHTFRMGNVNTHSYEELFTDSTILSHIKSSMNEGIPGCSECAYQPVCGSDPVYHYRTQGDIVGHRPTSGYCYRNMEVLNHLVKLMEDDPKARMVFRNWNRR